jgi:catabolite regulation protein CreA
VAIACRQIGPIVFKEPLRDGERVFDAALAALQEPARGPLL